MCSKNSFCIHTGEWALHTSHAPKQCVNIGGAGLHLKFTNQFLCFVCVFKVIQYFHSSQETYMIFLLQSDLDRKIDTTLHTLNQVSVVIFGENWGKPPDLDLLLEIPTLINAFNVFLLSVKPALFVNSKYYY